MINEAQISKVIGATAYGQQRPSYLVQGKGGSEGRCVLSL
jgi:hypothetical protein